MIRFTLVITSCSQDGALLEMVISYLNAKNVGINFYKIYLLDEIELKDPNSASPSLLKARSYVIPNDKCKKLYPNVDAGNICTLGARTGGTCRVRIINYGQ